MQALKDSLKSGQWKKVYLFYGEESYLKRSYKKQVKNAIVGENDSMNYNYFEGREAVNVNEIMAIADTLPFFADRRLIIIEDSGLFKTTAADEFCEYMSKVSDTTVLLFIESEIDKRNKLYKAVASNGSVIEMGRQPEGRLTDWIVKMLVKEGKNITRRDMDYLLERTGNDMENISNEVTKLIDYTYGRDVICREDIDAVCTGQITGRIFEMIDAVSEGKQKRALELYGDLMLLKEPPMRILFMLSRQFTKLLQAEELIKKGMGKTQLAEQMKIQPFIAGKYIAQLQKFSAERIKKALEECAATEEAVKTGFLNDRLGVELLLVNCSMN